MWLGLFGLVASFHGIIIGYSRQIFALARAGYLPRVLGRVHPRFRTPHVAILAGGVVGIAAIFSDELVTFGGQTLTANIVTMSVFGAIVMYILSMASLFKLRRSEPQLARPFRAPAYPWFPAFALGRRRRLPGDDGLLQPARGGSVRRPGGDRLRLLPDHPDATRRSARAGGARRKRLTLQSALLSRYVRRCKSAIRLRSATTCNTSRARERELAPTFLR